MFGKAFSTVFGPSSPLRNEPTIDYNNTIHSLRTNGYESTIDSLDDRYRRSKNNEAREDTNYYNRRENDKFGMPTSYRPRPNSYMDDHSYRNGGRDNYAQKSSISANFNRRSDLDNRYAGAKPTFNRSIGAGSHAYRHSNIIDNDFDDDSDEELNHEFNVILENMTKTNEKIKSRDTQTLPFDYPGKFVGGTQTKPTYNQPSVKYGHNSHTSTLNREIEALRKEIDREEMERQKAKASVRDTEQLSQREQLKDLANKLQQNNEFLTNVSELVELDEEGVAPPDLAQKYESLKSEYLSELKNMESFYKAFYKLMFKYRSLKSNKKKSSISMREKVNVIKASTNQSSIKNMCDGLLSDINNNDDILSYYKDELAKAHDRIAELEKQSKK